MNGYLIPAGQQRTEILVVNSRFFTSIGYAPTVVDAAKAFISSIRAEMPDANHHVYAFRVGYGNSIIEGVSDDGEPTGTSGPPVLAVLRGRDIGDTSYRCHTLFWRNQARHRRIGARLYRCGP